MKHISRRFMICCLLALTCYLHAEEERRYNIVSREVTAAMGEATSTNHVRQFVSREVTVGMGEATSTNHVRQIVSREVTVGMGEATSTNHVRNFVSREYTAGVGEEAFQLLPESVYLAGTVELRLDAQFVQIPLQMTFNWSLRHNGATLASGLDADWENFRYAWDTTSGEDGPYDMEMRFVRPNREDVVLSRRYYVLNTSGESHFNETISGDTTWKNDGKVHIVIGKTTVQDGGSLVVEPGAIVKFVNGASLVVEKGGSLDLSGVILTHFADDAHGGDTNGDGAQSMPQYNQYTITVEPNAQYLSDEDTQLCYLSFTYSGRITSDTTWLGSCLILVTDDITIGNGATLTIQPGTIVKMAYKKGITVQSDGTLYAIGTRAQPIVFTSYWDDAHGGDTDAGSQYEAENGDWKSISVYGDAILKYCTLMYGAPSNETGIVDVRSGGWLWMDSCTVAHALYDGVWNWGGDLMMDNSIVVDCGNAVAPYRGLNDFRHCVFYDNSYAIMYWSSWSGEPFFLNCIFKDMTAGWFESNGASFSFGDFGNCLFHAESSSQLTPPSGIGHDGNIWADPKFMDAKSWNFQLRPDSPCIDAGDGTVSYFPQYDYYGNPRRWSDGRVTPTGIADAYGNYPDIGLFEMCGEMDSDLDIAVNWVEGPTSAMAGDTVTVRWQAANIGTVVGGGVRRDNIYLVSKDERLGNRRVFVATATVNSRLAPNGIVSYAFDKAKIPPVTPGKWAFAVFANEERDWFEGRNIENNYLVSAGECEIVIPAIACTAQGATLKVNRGENVGFQLTNVPADGAMLVVRGGNGIRVTGQFGQLPESASQGWTSVNLGNGVVLLTIPPAIGDGDVFILLENTGNEDTQVELSGLSGAFALFDNGVVTAANSGTVTIPLYGLGLTADMDVYLKQGADRIDASSLTVAENGTVYATFDVAGAAVGSWTLFASNENGSDSLEALTLTQALKGPQWWCKLELPSAIRRGRTVIGTFIYGNSGDADMDAPYVKIEGDTGVNVRFSESDAWGKTIEFLALSATYPVSRLRAGEERRQTFEFIQLNDATTVSIHYEYVAKEKYSYVNGSDKEMIPTPFPWETNGKVMRPDWVSDADWTTILGRLKSSIGSSWNSCLDRMRTNADYLAMLGQGTNDFGLLWQLDVREAMAVDNAVDMLAFSSDLARIGRGFSIMVSRRFGTSMKTRNLLGMFGKGWAMSYETKVVLKDGGETLAFEIPSGSSYTFSKATGIWRSTVVGDKTQLEETNGAYILKYQDDSSATYAKSIGRLTSIRDCNGNGLDFQFSGNQLDQIIHTDGQWVKFTYNGSYVSKMEDDLGHVVNYTYDGNRLASVSGTDGLTTEYVYDNAANALKKIAYPNGTTRDYTYDDMGRVSSISYNGNQQTVVIDRDRFGSYTVIDSDGGVFETVVGASGELLYAVDALGNKTIARYDNNVAAVTSIQTPMGRKVHYEYDKDFNVTRSVGLDGTATEFTYSKDFGGLERYTDAKGHSVSYAYDDKGQGIGNMLADGKGGSMEYNGKGDIVSTTDRSGRNRTNEYDAQGRLIRSTDADNHSQELVYDAKGNVVKLKDSLLGDTTMTYTAEEWLKSVTYADGSGFSYAYDDCGRLIKQTYSDGFVQNYEYDALGRVSRMTDKNGNLLVGLDYDAATGQLLSKTFGNGTSVHYAYDLNGNLLSITHQGKDGSVLESFQYTYDADGRRTHVKSSEGVEAYTYDMAGQLTSVIYPDGTTETFQYDAVGNRTTANGVDYTVNELNQYLKAGDATFVYDDNGNMISKTDVDGITTYEYDTRSRLVRVVRPNNTTWSCQYDALGNRTLVNDNGQIRKQLYTLGSLPSLAAEYDVSGKLIRRYILLGNMLIADMDATGTVRYCNDDALGSIRLLTNGEGTVVSRQSYSAFGGLRTTSGEAMRFGFVGLYGVEADATGLVFMRNRYYESSLGRFMQMDPIGIRAGDVNWYRYCENRPNMAIDADGKEPASCKEPDIKVTSDGFDTPENLIYIAYCEDDKKNRMAFKTFLNPSSVNPSGSIMTAITAFIKIYFYSKEEQSNKHNGVNNKVTNLPPLSNDRYEPLILPE